MDSVSSVLPPTTHSTCDNHARSTRLAWILLLVAFVVYGVILWRHVGVYAGGSDSSGYMNHARLLASGSVHTPPRDLPQLDRGPIPYSVYSALGFKIAPDQNGFVPTYPAGLPVMIMLAAQVVGWEQAGNAVMWLHGMAGVWIAFALGRVFGLSFRTALIGSVIVVGGPLYLFMTLQAMSDVPALIWTAAAIAAAWHSRTRPRWAFAAGAAFSMAVLIRPTDALALVPLALSLGLSWRRWLAFIAGGIPGAIFFLLHTHAAYGSYFTTGYGSSAGLEAQWIGMTLRHYAAWLPTLFTPVVVAFVALPFLLRRAPLKVLVLGTWFLVFAGFYSAYSCTHETWWYLRFLLPCVPALVVGALLVLQTAAERWLPRRYTTAVAICALVVSFAWLEHWDRKFFVLTAGSGERVYLETASWLKANLPGNAVVAVMQHSGAVYYYTDFTFIRYDELHGTDFARIAAALRASGRPFYAVLVPFEITEEGALSRHMPLGSWAKVGAVRDVTIWKWSPESPARSGS